MVVNMVSQMARHLVYLKVDYLVGKMADLMAAKKAERMDGT